MPSLNLTVSVATFPEGWSGDYNDFAQKLAELLILEGSGDFLTGQVGGTTPLTNVGLFIDGRTIRVWDEDLAAYVPSNTVPIGGAIPYFGSTAPTDYLLCDHAEYAKADYADLYAIIGDNHKKVGDSADNFRVPDLRGRVPTGAGVGQYNVKDDESDWPVDGDIKERALGDYWGSEWPIHRETTQAGAPTQRTRVDFAGSSATNPPFTTDTTYYTGIHNPAAACNYIIRAK